MAASAASLGDLPDDLLGRCLGMLPLREGRSVTLVCKRFQRLFLEQPALWRRFQVTGSTSNASKSVIARLEAKHAQLQRVAPFVQEFEACQAAIARERVWTMFADGRARPLASFLELLPPSLTALQLQPHRYHPLPPETLPLLQPLTALRSLRLGHLWDPGELPAAVQRLPQLEHLECGCCPDGLLDAVCPLSGLMALQLKFQREQPPLPQSALQQLTRLSQLRCLTLTSRTNHTMQPPAPAAFPLLTTYEMYGPYRGAELAGKSLRYCAMAPLEHGAGRPIGLRVEAQQLHSFASLLAAAVPAAVTLQALSLSGVRLDAAGLQGCTQLVVLQYLELSSCPLDAEAVEALFSCTPRLDTLRASCADPDQARVLCHELPARVHTLELSGGLQSPPHELFQLRSLECLDLTGSWNLTVTEAEMEELASLLHLRALGLGSHAMLSLPQRARRAWQRRLKGVLLQRPGASLFHFESNLPMVL